MDVFFLNNYSPNARSDRENCLEVSEKSGNFLVSDYWQPCKGYDFSMWSWSEIIYLGEQIQPCLPGQPNSNKQSVYNLCGMSVLLFSIW